MRAWIATPAAVMLCAAAAVAQSMPTSPAPLATTVSNPIEMEFVLVPPGTITIGRFHAICPVRGPDGTAIWPPAGAPGSGRQSAPARPGARGGAGGPARTPPDPRTLWTPQDFARCAGMARRDERPGVQVRVDRPFYLGKYEVTQAQWKAVMKTNPSVFQGGLVTDDGDQHPVDHVSWEDAQAFIRELNELDPTARYRLPTEFEWELAAYAGSPDEPTWAAARAQAATGTQSTFRVGSKQPNAFGIHDMFGNVWEWVEDWYNEKLFPDPTPPATGTQHVLKGASFIGDVKNFTPATHAAGPASGWDVGFRVVREVR